MAKKKSSYSDVTEMQDMSMEDLQSRFYSLAQRAEARNSARASTLGQDAAPQKPAATPASSFASLDLGGGVESASDFDTMNIDQLAEKYLDPATLETRPNYADGSAPERAIPKAVDGATWNRVKLAFGNKKPDETVKYLEQDYGAGNVVYNQKRGQYSIKKDGAWFQLDPEGGGQGDIIDRALERTRDVLADNADIAVTVGAGIATAGAAIPLAAGLTGGAAVLGAAGVGASSGAGGAMSRVLMGRLAGTYEATPEQMARDIGVETLLGMAGGAFVPGVKYGKQGLASMFAKAQPELQKAAPASKELMQKIIGFTSGAGEDAVAHWMDNVKVPKFLAQYADDAEGAILKNVEETKQIAQNVVAAKRGYANDIYGKFAEEAGDNFKPWVGKIFTGSNVEAPPLSLMQSGVLKYGKGELALNVADDVTNVFGRKESLDILEPLVTIVNDFNRAVPAAGKDGARQYLVFKERLNAALLSSEALATAPGRNEVLALNEARKLKAELLTAYANKAVDAKKAPELVGKLAALDKEYARISTLTDDFEAAVRKGGDLNTDPYRSLYDKTFAQNKISSRSAVNKSEFNQIMDKLGKYSPEIGDLADNIGARKAALAASPWLRPGMATNPTAAASGVAGLAFSPSIAGAGIIASSPKVNYNMARMASSLFDGLDFVRKLPASQRMQMLQTPEAIAQMYKTVLEVPGLEAQTAIQLKQMMQGGGNGQ
jgi:hypothetical protein